jgi:hypothetical protein
MRAVGVLLGPVAILTVASVAAPVAEGRDTSYTLEQAPGNGSAAVATQPPAGRSGRPHNTSERLRMLHPEAAFATLVGLLAAVSVVLSIRMVREAFRRPHPSTTRRSQ